MMNKDEAVKKAKEIERLLLALTEGGYCMFVNDGTVQFFHGANPPRDRFGMVKPDDAIYSCSPRMFQFTPPREGRPRNFLNFTIPLKGNKMHSTTNAPKRQL